MDKNIVSEQKIKDLLKKKFEGIGNFQQTEFNSGAGSSRRDFVILGDDYFHYYEIKTEKDNFSRLPSQISNAVGLFTKMYVVGSRNKIAKLWKMNIAIGLVPTEDLEGNNNWNFKEQKIDWKLSIKKVIEILWANDLRNYINKKKPGIRGLGRMTVDNLQKIFLAHYTDKDCLTILNETLNTERYDWRKINESKNL